MAKASVLPRYYEYETFKRSVNRKVWVVVAVLSFVSVVALGLTLMAIARPIPVVVFDSQGRPLIFKDTATPRMTLDQMRVEYFSKKFVRLWVGIDSGALATNAMTSLNMMTPERRALATKDEEHWKKRRDLSQNNVRTVFADLGVLVGQFEPGDYEGRVKVLVTGKMVLEPRYGKKLQVSPPPTFFLTELVLDRVPIRTNSIHGLLVEYVKTDTFDSEHAFRSHMNARSM